MYPFYCPPNKIFIRNFLYVHIQYIRSLNLGYLNKFQPWINVKLFINLDNLWVNLIPAEENYTVTFTPQCKVQNHILLFQFE